MRYGAELPKTSVTDAELNVAIVGQTDNTVSYVLATDDGRAVAAMWSKIILLDFIED